MQYIFIFEDQLVYNIDVAAKSIKYYILISLKLSNIISDAIRFM